MPRKSSTDPVSIGPRDLLKGLGVAERELLATCLALFDDSTLSTHLGKVYEKSLGAIKRLTGHELDESAESVRSRLQHWLESPLTDDELRLTLWICLREAFQLPPRLSISMRGGALLADDLTAAAINAIDPPGAVKSGKRWLEEKGWLQRTDPVVSLADLVIPVLEEMLAAALQAETPLMESKAKQEFVKKTVSALAVLSEEDQQAFLKSTGARDLNDAALRKVLVAGGGLSAISAAVSVSGFSAYILAAQASAFIPLVSGPGLVSLIAVLANPLTVIGATAAVAIWSGRSASQKVKASVGVRVMALLVIRGLHEGHSGIAGLLCSFSVAPKLNESSGISRKIIGKYLAEWKLLARSAEKPLPQPPVALMRILERPLSAPAAQTKPRKRKTKAQAELENAAALTTLTLGDIIYCAASINPAVINAADFSRINEIESSHDFALFAQGIMGHSHAAIQGATNNLKGYVAEQMVAANLVAAGHSVSLPDTSNQAGWDLLVDGHPFQVKFHKSLSGLREHFDRYEFPVFANAELAEKIPEEWADRIFFIDGLTSDRVERVTTESLEAGAGLIEPDIPVFALAISTYRGCQRVLSGNIGSLQAIEQVIVDGSVRVGLVSAGTLIGTSTGLLLLGPAGAWILGAGAPILAQSQAPIIIDWIERATRRAMTEWSAATHDSLDRLQKVIVESLEERRQQLITKYRKVKGTDLGSYVRWRIADDGRFTNECAERINRLDRCSCADPRSRTAEILRLLAASNIHPVCYQSSLSEVSEKLSQQPGFLDWLSQQQPKETAIQLLGGLRNEFHTLIRGNQPLRKLKSRASAAVRKRSPKGTAD